jgi:hypothetical protein
MTREAKPPPSASPPVPPAAKWAPLREAFALAESAGDDLTEHFRSGRVTTAMRGPGGTLERHEPAYWESRRVMRAGASIVVVGNTTFTYSEPFFVERAALGKLYSTDPTPSDAPTRRNSGPQPEAKPRPATGKRKAGAKGNPWWPDLIRHLKARFPRRPHPDSDVSFNAAKDWLVDNKKALPAESTIRNGLRKRLPTWPRDSRRA